MAQPSRHLEEPPDNRDLCAVNEEHDGASDERRERQAEEQTAITLHFDPEDRQVAANRADHDAPS